MSATRVAAIVTETTWERVENRAAIARQRLAAGKRTIANPLEPELRTVTYRTAHADRSCPRAKGLPIVAEAVTLDVAVAGLPCDWCFGPLTHVDDAPTALPAGAYHESGDPDAKFHPAAKPNHVAAADGPTDKQVDWWRTLYVEALELRDGPGDYSAHLAAAEARKVDAGDWTRAGVSSAIARGLAAVKNLRTVARDNAPKTVGPNVTPLADVAEGHYAIPSSGSNDLAFYRVDRPTEGAHAGRVFVKLIVGGHPDSNVPRAHVAGVLARIAELGPDECAKLYGQELGRCCRCNRTLTDETSRRLGIGPECRGKR